MNKLENREGGLSFFFFQINIFSKKKQRIVKNWVASSPF